LCVNTDLGALVRAGPAEHYINGAARASSITVLRFRLAIAADDCRGKAYQVKLVLPALEKLEVHHGKK
jgi:hypothetical protein